MNFEYHNNKYSGLTKNIPLNKLGELLSNPGIVNNKDDCPLIKLAHSKDGLSLSNSYIEFYGVSGDYDGESKSLSGVLLTIKEVYSILKESGIEAHIHTTPSNKINSPRWRVHCPFAKPHTWEETLKLTGILNAILNGALCKDSYDRGRRYYVGRVNEEYEYRYTQGLTLDTFAEFYPDLPEIYPEKQAATSDSEDFTAGVELESEHVSQSEIEKLKSALEYLALKGHADDRALWLRVGYCLKRLGEVGKELFVYFSGLAFNPAYKTDDVLYKNDRQWQTFHVDRAGRFGIYSKARSEGWFEPLTEEERQQRRLIPTNLMTARIRPAKWLIDGYLEQDSVSMIFGESSVGKSLFALDWAFCISNGIYWGDVRTKARDVVYVAGEGTTGLSRRIKAIEQKYTMGSSFYCTEGARDLFDTREVRLLAEDIKETCQYPGLLIVDTLNTNFGGDENSSGDIGSMLRLWRSTFNGLGMAILIVHHSGHSDKGRARGSGSLYNNCDTVFQVTKQDTGPRLECRKNREGKLPYPTDYAITPVSLDNVDYTDCDPEDALIPVTSVYLEYLGQVLPDDGKAKLSDMETQIINIIQDLATFDETPSNDILTLENATDAMGNPRTCCKLESLKANLKTVIKGETDRIINAKINGTIGSMVRKNLISITDIFVFII